MGNMIPMQVGLSFTRKVWWPTDVSLVSPRLNVREFELIYFLSKLLTMGKATHNIS